MQRRWIGILIFFNLQALHASHSEKQHLNNFILFIGRLMTFIFLLDSEVVRKIQFPFLYTVCIWMSGIKFPLSFSTKNEMLLEHIALRIIARRWRSPIEISINGLAVFLIFTSAKSLLIFFWYWHGKHLI